MDFSPELKDALAELINIGVGKSASILSEMLGLPIKLSIPEIEVVNENEIENKLIDFKKERLASVKLDFTGEFSGRAAIVFPPTSAANLVSALTGEDLGSPDLDSVRAGTLSEVGNIVLNGIMGSIANILKQQFSFNIPSYGEDSLDKLLIDTGKNDFILVGKTSFSIENLKITGDFLLIIDLKAFEKLNTIIEGM